MCATVEAKGLARLGFGLLRTRCPARFDITCVASIRVCWGLARNVVYETITIPKGIHFVALYSRDQWLVRTLRAILQVFIVLSTVGEVGPVVSTSVRGVIIDDSKCSGRNMLVVLQGDAIRRGGGSPGCIEQCNNAPHTAGPEGGTCCTRG